LTDTRWKLEGKTVLYIPTEGFKLASEDAAKNKELVQRLESKLLTIVTELIVIYVHIKNIAFVL